MSENKISAEEQRLDNLKEQTEDEFFPEDQEEPENVPYLKLCCKSMSAIIAVCQQFGWKTEGIQEIKMITHFADNKDISLRDVAEVAHSIHKYSTVGTLEETTEEVLRTLKAYYTK